MARFVLPLLTLLLSGRVCLAQTDSLCVKEMIHVQDTCFRFINKNQFDSALPYAQRLESLVTGWNGDSMKLANIFYLEAELYRLLWQETPALSFYRRCIALYALLDPKDPSNRQNYAFSYSRMGNVYYRYGDMADAETWLTKALVMDTRFNLMGDYAQVLLSLGNMAERKGDYARAIGMEERSMSLLDTLPKSAFGEYLKLSIQSNIGMIYFQEGNLQKALSQMKVSEATLRQLDTAEPGARYFVYDDYVRIMLNLADIYFANGLIDSAMARVKVAEMLIPSRHSGGLLSNLLEKKALFAERQGHPEEAIDLLRTCLRIADTLLLKPDEYNVNRASLGVLYNETGRYTEADSLFRTETTQLRQAGLDYSYARQQSMIGLCASLIGRGDYAEAADSLLALSRLSLTSLRRNFSGLSEADQLLYKRGLQDVFDLLYTCLSRNGGYRKEVLRQTYLLELEQKNLVLNSEAGLLRQARDSRDTPFLETYHAWLANRQVLSQQYALPLDQRPFSTDSLEAENEVLEKRVAALDHQSAVAAPMALPPAAASIAFLRYHVHKNQQGADTAYYAAFILRPGDTIPVFVRLCPEAALSRLFEDTHGNPIDEDQLTQELYDGLHKGSRALYRLVWQPLEPYLGQTRTIYYSTAGLLDHIAFHAIHTDKGYLMTRYSLHRYLDVADRGYTSPERPAGIYVWGNINYDTAVYGGIGLDSNAALATLDMRPSAMRKNVDTGPMQALGASEVTGLKQLFDQRHVPFASVEGGDATEERFKEQASSLQGILHISTHGFYTPFHKEQAKASTPGSFIAGTVNPLFRCGLAFAGANYYWLKGIPRSNRDDGILTGYEIEQLDLRRVQLVTLSACETGLGDVTDNEGTLGLQRAFRLAGARRLLVSLWQVPARQTAELLSLFYAAWLKGTEPGEALRSAENTLRQKGYPPYYWAGFVLVE